MVYPTEGVWSGCNVVCANCDGGCRGGRAGEGEDEDEDDNPNDEVEE